MSDAPQERADDDDQPWTLLRAGSQPVTFLRPDGAILHMNQAALANLRLTRAEALGASFYTLVPAIADVTRERIDRVMTSKQTLVVEDDVQLPAGLRSFRSTIDPVFDDHGVICAVQVTSSDVTAEHAVAASLRRADRRIATIGDHSPFLILTLDRAGRVTYINRVQPGFRLEDVVGNDARGPMAPAFHPAFDAALEQVFEQGQGARLEFSDVLGNWWIVHIVPMVNDGRVEQAMSFSMDITERHHAEEHQAQLQREMFHAQKLEGLGVLAGGIAHDFNNLLQVISINADIARAGLPTGDPGREPLDDVMRATTRAAELCQQMLAYAGRGRFSVARLDLSQLVSEMAELLAVSVPKGVRIERQLATDLPAVEADPVQLRQVVLNLITNAADAIGLGQGTVTVTTRRAELTGRELGVTSPHPSALANPWVVLEVADDGSGIDAATRARMFEPFFSTKASGRGLGLAATQGIVRRHGGVILVDSVPGAGTKIRAVMPALSAPPEVAVAPRVAVTLPGHGLILVVDDEAALRRGAERALVRAGYEVVLAEDGREGLARYDEHRARVSLVLLDLTMPVLGGEQTLLQLRARDPGVPVVIMSGYSESAPRVDSVRFLAKPFRLETLVATVATALADGRDQGPGDDAGREEPQAIRE